MLCGQWLDDLANHIPAGPVIAVIELDELNQGLNVSSLSRISRRNTPSREEVPDPNDLLKLFFNLDSLDVA